MSDEPTEPVVMNKISKIPYSFKANPDGSLTFSLQIEGTIDQKAVIEQLAEVLQTLHGRVRFEENSVQIADIITSLPKCCIDDWIKVSIGAAATKPSNPELEDPSY